MRVRRLISLLSLLSFGLLLVTSIVLYIVPHGRVAYWVDWTLWGLSKTQWQNLHINLGFLFLLSVFFHLYYNWNSITHYFKNKLNRLIIFTKEFNVALLIILLVSGGTYFMVPPFSTIIDFSEVIKEKASLKYGNPPYGHAELSSLKVLCQRLGLDLKQVLNNLKKRNIKFSGPQDTILEIARINNLTPKQVYEIAIDYDKKKAGLSAFIPLGIGKLTLKEFCQQFGLNLQDVVLVLEKNGYVVKANTTLKEIAASRNQTPSDLYKLLQQNFN
ncbi:protein of unknown function [Desulfonauticus submarinus]|uniref:Flavinylation-associated cytochrome domain-containing protein n=1 Tax=Desulfonauticus submarinus TaxID=206665 RepID=A0A1H0D842_9BACT|nr:DUF4405 domain-containing protein [Desulfonauticus submarinus]SDN66146.1 protein of unknown function [Desulfonauticus submarinus]